MHEEGNSDKFHPKQDAEGGRGTDDYPVEFIPGDPSLGLLLTCDHASNHVPAEFHDLGLPREEFARHIAYDIGAAAVTRALALRFGVPAVLSRFSRLLIDPNRGLDDPTLVMRLSDGAIIPGNARIDAAGKEARVNRFYRPYDDAIGAAIEAAIRVGRPPMVLAMHSFTPFWKGVPRPWHIGILWDQDPRLALPLIDGLGADPAILVGDNEPYHGALKGDSLYRHATRRGLAHALVELRQDLVADDPGIEEWTRRLAEVLQDLDLEHRPHPVEYYGSLTGPVAIG